MNVYVFTGPTLSAAAAANELPAVYLPPVAEGDVYRVALKHPQAIGIVDGYFQSVPSVRHKEILWAMSRGIHVFGSSSIGALRAAELAAFGMEGVGQIFMSFRDGSLEDDDEVAIAHGPEETGYAPGSEAMVNIRATLRAAESAGIITSGTRLRLEQIGKEFFFPDRNYAAIVERGLAAKLPQTQLMRLRDWLPRGRRNQKRDDAIAMLRLMRQKLTSGLKRKEVSFTFQNTAMWTLNWRHGQELRSETHGQPSAANIDAVLEELRLQGDGCRHHTLLALERFFAIREAYRLGLKVDGAGIDEAKQMFCRQLGLDDSAQLEQWKVQQGLAAAEFDTLMADEARVRWIHQLSRSVLPTCLAEHLRLSGDYSNLVRRAAAKERLLDDFGCQNPSLKHADITEEELFHWYFSEVVRQKMPRDPVQYALQLGFASAHSFLRAVLREYLYRRLASEVNTKAAGTAPVAEG